MIVLLVWLAIAGVTLFSLYLGLAALWMNVRTYRRVKREHRAKS